VTGVLDLRWVDTGRWTPLLLSRSSGLQQKLCKVRGEEREGRCGTHRIEVIGLLSVFGQDLDIARTAAAFEIEEVGDVSLPQRSDVRSVRGETDLKEEILHDDHLLHDLLAGHAVVVADLIDP
jgi:hypothetical protein